MESTKIIIVTIVRHASIMPSCCFPYSKLYIKIHEYKNSDALVILYVNNKYTLIKSIINIKLHICIFSWLIMRTFYCKKSLILSALWRFYGFSRHTMIIHNSLIKCLTQIRTLFITEISSSCMTKCIVIIYTSNLSSDIKKHFFALK